MEKDFQLGQDIIEMYAPYVKFNPNFKKMKVISHIFEIEKNYQLEDIMGEGAYGVVVSAIDNRRDQNGQRINKPVAIKKIHRLFESRIYAKRTLRQLKLMRLLNHENILKIQTLQLPQSRQNFEYVYAVMQIMDTDLKKVIRSTPLQQKDIQYILYQIIKALKYIHSANIAHRDIKPHNILINSQCEVKICDFGLARLLSKNNKTNALTDYVATRWYRAPELLLSFESYTTAVDMWSVGCLFAEMLKKSPMLKGTDTSNQFQLIFQYFGVPNFETMTSLPSQLLAGLKKLGERYPKKPKDMKSLFPQASDLALDLLAKCFIFDPDKRITAKQALGHPYFNEIRDPQDQPQCQAIDELQFEFQDHDLKNQQLKDMIYEQILLYHFPEFKDNYEKKKKERKSLISHIITNSNSKYFDPQADNDHYDDDSDSC